MANPFANAVRLSKPRQQRNAFNASTISRLTSDWVMAASRSAEMETRWELRLMRSRARELVRNSPFGAQYHRIIAENVVGDTGFQLCAMNMKKDGSDFHESANKAIEEAWLEWCRPENCDITNKLSFTELMCLAASAWGTDGEIPIRFIRGQGYGPFGLKLQMIDADYFVDTLNQPSFQGVPNLSNGVKLGPWGEPISYYLWTRHPYDAQGRFLGDTKRDVIEVPAADMIHAFIPQRAGQVRGIPHLTSIMNMIKMLDGYVEAELVAARVASASMGAIEDLPNGEGPAADPGAGIRSSDSDDGYAQPGGQDIPAEAEPGALLDLRGKGKLTLWDPQHPTSAFPNFTRLLSHFAAMGLGMSYGTLTGDLSQANYGSLRVGMLDERDHWARFQRFMIVHVVDRIYREWLKMAILTGAIPGLTDADYTRWTRVEWQPRGFDWIDPLKDAQGDLLEIAAGTNNLTLMAAKRGRNLERVVQQRAREIKMLEKYGVPSVIAVTITDRPTESTSEGGATASGGGEDDTANQDGGTKTLPIRPKLAGTGGR